MKVLHRAPSLRELPAGTKLREYEILSVLGGGQTSLVYDAYDSTLNRHVTLKEYLPTALAARGDDFQLVALPGRDEAFDRGLNRFIAEAQAMTRFNHLALRHAYQFFRECGSAYIVMPYYPGKTLREMVRDDYRLANVGDLLMIVLPVLEGLSILHEAGYYHCGISPENILIQDSSEPILLDFGALQRQGEFSDDRPMTGLATGFAALEQYAQYGDNNSGMEIGAWTDIYAISAAAYYTVTGTVPPLAVLRLKHDTLKPLAGFASTDLPVLLLEAIDQGLSVLPQNRFESIEAFANALDVGLQEAMASSPPAAAGMGEIMALAATVSSYSPRARKILQSTWALRQQIRHRGAV